MKSTLALAAFIGLFSIQTLAASSQTVVCSAKGDSRFVELDLNTRVAVIKTVGSKVVEIARYTDTDSGTMYFEGPVHIFDYSHRPGFRGGIGYGNIADTKTNQNLFCVLK